MEDRRHDVSGGGGVVVLCNLLRHVEKSMGNRSMNEPNVTSMISTCQGKIHLPLHSTEEIPEAPSLGRIARRFACFDPLRFESTRQRDQTSICWNGSGPSTKIEFV